MAETLPRKDLDLIAQAKAAQTYAAANMVALGLVTADMTAFGGKIGAADMAMMNHQTARTNAASARAAKDTALDELEREWRQLRRKVRGNATLTDAQREGLGIPVAGLADATTAAVYTRPVVTVDNSMRLAHVLAFCEASSPDSKARPRGVIGAEVWMIILPKDAQAPWSAIEMRLTGMATTSPHVAKFGPEDAGKVAWYKLRWVTATGSLGGWSSLEGAMIMA